MNGVAQFGHLVQVDLLGIYVEPAVVCLLEALLVTTFLRRMLDRIGIDHLVWNRALFDLSLLVAVTALLILYLNPPGP